MPQNTNPPPARMIEPPRLPPCDAALSASIERLNPCCVRVGLYEMVSTEPELEIPEMYAAGMKNR